MKYYFTPIRTVEKKKDRKTKRKADRDVRILEPLAIAGGYIK